MKKWYIKIKLKWSVIWNHRLVAVNTPKLWALLVWFYYCTAQLPSLNQYFLELGIILIYNIAPLLLSYFWFVFRQYTWYLPQKTFPVNFYFQIHVKFIFKLLLLEMVAMRVLYFALKDGKAFWSWGHRNAVLASWAGLFSPRKHGGEFSAR